MPRLSPAGDAVTGFAGAILGINGVIPATFAGHSSGGWDWMSNTLLVGNGDFGAGFHLYTYNTVGPVLTLLDARGASYVGGGGTTHWAAFLADGVTGVYWSLGTPPISFAAAGLADVSPTGVTTIVQSFSAGAGLQAYSATGTLLWTITAPLYPSLPPDTPVCIRDNVLCFRTNPDYNVYDASTATTLAWTRRTATIIQMRPVSVAGVLYLLEFDGTTLTIRQSNSQQGYVVATTPDVPWGWDGILLTGTTVRVAWAGDAAETASTLVVADIDLSTGTWTKATVSGGVLVPVVQPALGLMPMAGTAVGGQQGGLEMVARHAMTDSKDIVTPEWLRYFRRMERFATALPNLSNSTGSVPPGQGGTGGGSGLSPLDGHNLNAKSVPYVALATDAVARMYAIASLRI